MELELLQSFFYLGNVFFFSKLELSLVDLILQLTIVFNKAFNLASVSYPICLHLLRIRSRLLAVVGEAMMIEPLRYRTLHISNEAMFPLIIFISLVLATPEALSFLLAPRALIKFENLSDLRIGAAKSDIHC